MNIDIIRSKAESMLADQYIELAGTLPGNAVVKAMRSEAMDRFRLAGLPHRRVEEWKYTDLRSAVREAYAPAIAGIAMPAAAAIDAALGPLAGLDATRLVLLDGAFAPALSNAVAMAEGVQFLPMRDALAEPDFAAMHGQKIPGLDAESVVALNSAFMTDGVALFIGVNPDRPIHIMHLSSGAAPASIATRNIICVAEGVEVTIIESHLALGEAAMQVNTLTHLGASANAKIEHVKLQCEAAATTHLSNWIVDLAANVDYNAFHLSTGAALARNQIFLRYSGEGSSANIAGAKVLKGKQHCDTTMLIDHAVPGCTSREHVKLVIDDEARGVFQAKVIVARDAQKSDGKQMAQALLLSETAEFDSKPELEIYADDVVCGHGSTAGELDEDHLFYLMARGLPREQAEVMLIEAFLGEAIDYVRHDPLREALSAITTTALRR